MDSMDSPPLSSREYYLYSAKLAEQTERYSEMVSHMTSLIHHSADLSPEERNLFSVAYKNIVGNLRAAWRIVSSIEAKETDEGRLVQARAYRVKVEGELNSVCEDVLRLLDQSLIPSATCGEAKVFYWKMKGDYCRYLAEFKDGDERDQAAKDTLDAYKAAQEIASAELPPTNPIRLGLALNFSVFYYEIQNSSEKACDMAKQAFEEAIDDLKTLDKESSKDSTLIMQLLRDNLTLWTSDMQEDQTEEPEFVC